MPQRASALASVSTEMPAGSCSSASATVVTGSMPVSDVPVSAAVVRPRILPAASLATAAEAPDATQSVATDTTPAKIADRRRADETQHRFAKELEARVEERTREFELAHAELEAAHGEVAAANQELQRLLREQERLQSELAYRALHDPLTGLANRTMFQERLDQAFRVSGRGVAVIWIDLDRFKEVNDIFGHEVGDEMLVAVADRLRDVVRETDDIARMGGDEFAIVLPNVIESEAQMVADRILDALFDRDAF